MHVLAENLGDCVSRDVVLSRPQTSRAEHHVRPSPGVAEGVRQSPFVVANLGHAEEVDPKRRQVRGNVLGIRVENLAEQDFRTDGDDLCVHSMLRPRTCCPRHYDGSIREQGAPGRMMVLNWKAGCPCRWENRPEPVSSPMRLLSSRKQLSACAIALRA